MTVQKCSATFISKYSDSER